MKTFQPHKTTLVTVLSLALLSACGGGDDDDTLASNNNDNAANGVSVSGVVADGYLKGVTVCLDTNENRSCDDGEPKSEPTGENGQYTITGISAGDENQYSIVADVPETAIDQDDGQPVGQRYVLFAPPGKPDFVSPLTTMIQTQVDRSGITVEEAEVVVKRAMGMEEDEDVSLFEDFVKAKRQNQKYATVHKVAQVVVDATQQNLGILKNKVSQNNSDAGSAASDAQVTAVFLDRLIDQLETIRDEIDTLDDEPVKPEFSGKLLADLKLDRDSIEKDDQHWNPELLRQEIEIHEKHRRNEPIKQQNIEQVLKEGIYDLKRGSFEEGASYQPLHATRLMLNDGTIHIEHKLSKDAGTSWLDVADKQFLALTKDGWQQAKRDNVTVTHVRGNNFTVEHPVSGSKQKVNLLTYDLHGEPLRQIASLQFIELADPNDRHRLIEFPQGPIYGPGSLAYKINRVHQSKSYYLGFQTDSCDASEQALLNGNCNAVKVGDEYATSLDDLINSADQPASTDDNSTIDVAKSDGSIQCEDEGTSLDEMGQQLLEADIEIIDSRTGHDPDKMVTTVCGAPTLQLNIYTIAAADAETARSLGFEQFNMPDEPLKDYPIKLDLGDRLQAALVTGKSASGKQGKVVFYHKDMELDSPIILNHGKWKRQTIRGTDMIQLKMPIGHRHDADAALLSVHDGFVRKGHYQSPGKVATEVQMNGTALANLMQQANMNAPFPLPPLPDPEPVEEPAIEPCSVNDDEDCVDDSQPKPGEEETSSETHICADDEEENCVAQACAHDGENECEPFTEVQPKPDECLECEPFEEVMPKPDECLENENCEPLEEEGHPVTNECHEGEICTPPQVPGRPQSRAFS